MEFGELDAGWTRGSFSVALGDRGDCVLNDIFVCLDAQVETF